MRLQVENQVRTRRVKLGIIAVAILTMAAGWACAAVSGQTASSPAAPAVVAEESGKALRILYAGHPGSDRERDFVDFLSKHFGAVKTGDLQAFKDGDAQAFDVTILDYDGDGFKAPRPAITVAFSRPAVTIGVVGGFACDSLNLKTGYS
jgi:hypothetical protein